MAGRPVKTRFRKDFRVAVRISQAMREAIELVVNETQDAEPDFRYTFSTFIIEAIKEKLSRRSRVGV